MPSRHWGHFMLALYVCVCVNPELRNIVAGWISTSNNINLDQLKSNLNQNIHNTMRERDARLHSFSRILWTMWMVALLVAKLMSIVCRIVLCKCLLDLFDVACNHIQWWWTGSATGLTAMDACMLSFSHCVYASIHFACSETYHLSVS